MDAAAHLRRMAQEHLEAAESQIERARKLEAIGGLVIQDQADIARSLAQTFMDRAQALADALKALESAAAAFTLNLVDELGNKASGSASLTQVNRLGQRLPAFWRVDSITDPKLGARPLTATGMRLAKAARPRQVGDFVRRDAPYKHPAPADPFDWDAPADPFDAAAV